MHFISICLYIKQKILSQQLFTLGFILLSALLLRVEVLSWSLNTPGFSLQQDHYADYAVALRSGQLHTGVLPAQELRLFPGYPFLITVLMPLTQSALAAGILISLGASVVAVLLFYLLTKRLWLTLFFSFFPPVWVKQGTKVATEPLTVALLLASLLLFFKKKPFLSGVLIGLAGSVRLIAVCLLLAQLLVAKEWTERKKLLLGFLPTFALLFIFNLVIFGPPHLLIQFISYPQIGGAGGTTWLGILQIIKDIFRALDWQQYTILISGSFYVLLNTWALLFLFKRRYHHQLAQVSFWWLLFSLLFIFSLAPVPLLEEFARFSVPSSPAVVLAIFYFFSNRDSF